MEGYQQGGRGGKMEGKGTGNKKHDWYAQNGQGEVKNSIGNGEARGLTYTTHGHELRWGNAGGEGRWRGIKGRKKWDNCNSIINKVHLKNEPTYGLTYLASLPLSSSTQVAT